MKEEHKKNHAGSDQRRTHANITFIEWCKADGESKDPLTGVPSLPLSADTEVQTSPHSPSRED